MLAAMLVLASLIGSAPQADEPGETPPFFTLAQDDVLMLAEGEVKGVGGWKCVFQQHCATMVFHTDGTLKGCTDDCQNDGGCIICTNGDVSLWVCQVAAHEVCLFWGGTQPKNCGTQTPGNCKKGNPTTPNLNDVNGCTCQLNGQISTDPCVVYDCI